MACQAEEGTPLLLLLAQQRLLRMVAAVAGYPIMLEGSGVRIARQGGKIPRDTIEETRLGIDLCHIAATLTVTYGHRLKLPGDEYKHM